MAKINLSNSMDKDTQSDTRESSPANQVNVGSQEVDGAGQEGFRMQDPVRGKGIGGPAKGTMDLAGGSKKGSLSS